jgi:hypothetical protein
MLLTDPLKSAFKKVLSVKGHCFQRINYLLRILQKSSLPDSQVFGNLPQLLHEEVVGGDGVDRHKDRFKGQKEACIEGRDHLGDGRETYAIVGLFPSLKDRLGIVSRSDELRSKLCYGFLVTFKRISLLNKCREQRQKHLLMWEVYMYNQHCCEVGPTNNERPSCHSKHEHNFVAFG